MFNKQAQDGVVRSYEAATLVIRMFEERENDNVHVTLIIFKAFLSIFLFEFSIFYIQKTWGLINITTLTIDRVAKNDSQKNNLSICEASTND